MAAWVAPAIMAGASLAGSLGGAAIQAGASGANNAASMAFSREQLEFQREAATMGIRWKVADAQAAGIHPIYALGAPTFNPSPIGLQLDAGPNYSAIGSQMGQDIGRAVAATQTPQERTESASQIIMGQQAIERGGLQNDLLRLQIASAAARLQADQIGPPMPNSLSLPRAGFGVYEAKPPEVLNSQPGAPFATAGPSAPGVTWERNADRSVVARPTKEQNIDEFSSPGYLNWMWQNRLLPFASRLSGQSGPAQPPASMLPEGAVGWKFTFPGKWDPVFPSIRDSVIQSSRHGTPLPKWADPTYRRY